MTTAIAQVNLLKRDSDGNWYSIPESIVKGFNESLEETLLHDSLSSEWFEAVQELNNNYGMYLIGVKE